MTNLRVLNLYAGIGGNRKLWPESAIVTAVEYAQDIADVYMDLYPYDRIFIEDAHEYLLQCANEYDVIWSSPPCQSHTRMIRSGRNRKPRYADLRLYEEIIHLLHNFNGSWVVENVRPYYEPLIEPAAVIGRHVFWSNVDLSGINDVPRPSNFINMTTVEGSERLKDWLGIHYQGNIYYEGNNCPAQVLRNAVHPEIGLSVFERLANWHKGVPV